jgi:hypothetical protein
MYIQIHSGDSGEQGWGDIFIPIPIYDSGDQSSPQVCGEQGHIAIPNHRVVQGLQSLMDAESATPRSRTFFLNG